MVVFIYDVHASESGALAILDDLYNQIRNHHDKSIKWVFIVSTPKYENTENIEVLRFPWVKKSWGHRFYFDNVTTRKLLEKYKPDRVFSLQNKGIPFYKGRQYVYLHLPFVLCDHRFNLKTDGKKLWLYQNVISKFIFSSLRKVDRTIVQTQWMKDALIKKARVSPKKISILHPDISTNAIGEYRDDAKSKRTFFYPATAFTYKNHMTILKALNCAQKHGFTDYEMIFTIKRGENAYTQMLSDYAKKHSLKVKFGGQVPREKVFELYTKSVLLFPSFVESFGLPLLEARLSGAYVLAADCPFSREILDGYKNAEFYSPLDYKKLAGQILKLNKSTAPADKETIPVSFKDNKNCLIDVVLE